MQMGNKARDAISQLIHIRVTQVSAFIYQSSENRAQYADFSIDRSDLTAD